MQVLCRMLGARRRSQRREPWRWHRDSLSAATGVEDGGGGGGVEVPAGAAGATAAAAAGADAGAGVGAGAAADAAAARATRVLLLRRQRRHGRPFATDEVQWRISVRGVHNGLVSAGAEVKLGALGAQLLPRGQRGGPCNGVSDVAVTWGLGYCCASGASGAMSSNVLAEFRQHCRGVSADLVDLAARSVNVAVACGLGCCCAGGARRARVQFRTQVLHVVPHATDEGLESLSLPAIPTLTHLQNSLNPGEGQLQNADVLEVVAIDEAIHALDELVPS